MKRSLVMTLAAVGAGAFGIWAFTASGAPQDAHGKIYRSADECARDGILSASACQAEWGKSLALHLDKAPVYATRASCEASHGHNQCVPASTSNDPARRSSFVPVMSGYVMGRLTNGGYQSAPLYKLKADEQNKHRMSAAPEPVRDSQGRSLAAFVWMSRTAARPVAASAGRSLWSHSARDGAKTRSASRAVSRSAARGGFGRASRGLSAAG